MRLGELLDALTGTHRARRKDARVGEHFDDYLVHAPRDPALAPREPDAGAAHSTGALDESLSARRLALPTSASQRRLVLTRSNYERSFDRPRTPRAHAPSPWKRTVSAPRALSEFTQPPPPPQPHPPHAAPTPIRSLSHLARHRHPPPRRELIAPNERPVPRQRVRYDEQPEIVPMPVGEPPPAPLPPGCEPEPSSSPPSPPPSSEIPIRGLPDPAQEVSYVIPRRVSSKRLLSTPPDLVHTSPQHVRISTDAASSTPTTPSPTQAADVRPTLPRRTSSKKVKKRPPPLVTAGAPHGFCAAGLREPTPVPDVNMSPSIVVLAPPQPHPPSSSSSAATNTTSSSKHFGGSSSLLSLKRSNSRQRSTATQPSSGVHALKRVNSRQRPYQEAPSAYATGTSPPTAMHPAVSINTAPLSRSDSRSRVYAQQPTPSHLHPDTAPPPEPSTATTRPSTSRRRIHNAPRQMPNSSQRPQQPHPPADTSPTTKLFKSNSRSRLHYSSSQSVKRVAAQRQLTDRVPAVPFMARPLADSELLFEEATSISSLGEGDTLGRNTRHREMEVQEDVFVIGGDGVFKGGGFEISKNGMLKSPGNLTRKLSDGTAVDGVPRSSNNLIIVRSMAEFARGAPLSRRTKVDSTLGAGAAGRVSLAVHRPSGRKIAVKRINVFDAQKRTQLLKELETLMCYDSRFLVRSYGAFYDGEGVVHVTLEYMDRGALSDAVELRGAVPEHIVVHIAEHCLRGLRFLHDNHVLHRDFKTSNILLSRRTCRAKLADFGLARELRNGESRVDTFVGTVGYMAPERLKGREYTYASDVWALGICVLECLLGHYPFPKPQNYFDYLHAAHSDPASLVRASAASADCVDFIRQCTAEDPAARPTVHQLLAHPWIAGLRDTNAFREWLESVPQAHEAGQQPGAAHGASSPDDGLRKAKERAHELEGPWPRAAS